MFRRFLRRVYSAGRHKSAHETNRAVQAPRWPLFRAGQHTRRGKREGVPPLHDKGMAEGSWRIGPGFPSRLRGLQQGAVPVHSPGEAPSGGRSRGDSREGSLHR